MARVALEGVSKVYPGDVTAVQRIDLEVNDQEFLVLVGPSGCGKTTTLRLIAGLETPSDGTIHIGKQAVNNVAPKDRNIAMVFQNYALYPHMSVYKNMAFGLQLRYGGGWPARILKRLIDPPAAAEMAKKRQGIDQQVRQAAEMLGIEHLLDRMPRQLSGGERQRVALGRAIVRKPAAFLFDEPLSNLDAKLRVEMRRELKRLHGQLQATMIYVTHDQVEALTLGQRIVVMENGRVQQLGAPMDVYDRPRNRFVASFIGTPPMNFVCGEMNEVEDKLQFTGEGLTAEFCQADFDETVWERRKQFADKKDVVFGVRPEDVTARPTDQISSTNKNRGQVADVELLGDSAVVQVELKTSDQEKNKTNTILLKTAARTTLAVGDEVELTIDVSRAHLFDPQTDENLTYTESK